MAILLNLVKSIVCSMLCSSDMSIRRCCSCRLPPAMGETSVDDVEIPSKPDVSLIYYPWSGLFRLSF